MANEVKELLDRLNREWAEYKELNEKRIKDLEKKGHTDPLIEEKMVKMDEALTAYEEKLEKTRKELEHQIVELKRSPIASEEKGVDAHARRFFEIKAAQAGRNFDPSAVSVDDYVAYKQMFNHYLRKGDGGLSPDEVKALSVGSDPDGGYTVTPEQSNRVVEIIFETSPIRELATVETITSSSYEILADVDEVEGGWVGETGTRSDTGTPQIRKIEIPAHEIYAQPPVTQKMLDDSTWDVEGWLTRKIGRKFGRVEAAAFVTGDGIEKPRGILTYPDGTSFGQIEQIASGAATDITYDGLVDLEAALIEEYRANAMFLMHRRTLAAIRKLKDANGQPLWSPAVAEATPSTIMGYRYRLAGDMPIVAANALAIAFGDFREAYTIVDRAGIRILRDPYTAKPYVRFYATTRVGGAVTNFQAIKLMKIA